MLERKQIGKRIRACFPGQTQGEIGKRLNVSQRLVSDWERGKVFPRLVELEKVVKETGCTWDWLLEGKESYPAEALSGRVLTHVQLGLMQGLVRKLVACLHNHETFGREVIAIATSLDEVMKIPQGEMEAHENELLKGTNDKKTHPRG